MYARFLARLDVRYLAKSDCPQASSPSSLSPNIEVDLQGVDFASPNRKHAAMTRVKVPSFVAREGTDHLWKLCKLPHFLCPGDTSLRFDARRHDVFSQRCDFSNSRFFAPFSNGIRMTSSLPFATFALLVISLLRLGRLTPTLWAPAKFLFFQREVLFAFIRFTVVFAFSIWDVSPRLFVIRLSDTEPLLSCRCMAWSKQTTQGQDIQNHPLAFNRLLLFI